MKKIMYFLTLLAILLVHKSIAQGAKYKYEYDAAGNRVKRSFIVEGPVPPGGGARVMTPPASADNDSTNIEDKLSKIPNEVFPNPTFGLLNVVINNNSNSKYSLINPVGQLVNQGDLNIGTNVLDLSQQQRGNYFLKIIKSSGEIETWKILKQ